MKYIAKLTLINRNTLACRRADFISLVIQHQMAGRRPHSVVLVLVAICGTEEVQSSTPILEIITFSFLFSLSLPLSVCLYVCLSVCLPVCLSVCLSHIYHGLLLTSADVRTYPLLYPTILWVKASFRKM